MFSSSFVCLSLWLLATLSKNVRTDLREIFREGWQWASEQTIKCCWRSGSPSDTGLFSVFVTIGRYDCAALCCSAGHVGHALAGIAIATMTSRSLRHRPTTLRQPRQPVFVNDVTILVSRALAEVCTVPVLIVYYETLRTLDRVFSNFKNFWDGGRGEGVDLDF